MHNDTKNNFDVTSGVMERIKSGKVKMKPRLYFVATSIVLAGGFMLSIFFASFMINMLSWRIRQEGPFAYLGMGRMGLRPFMGAFPWLILAGAILLIALGLWMSRKFDFSYKRNALAVALGIAILPMIFGLAMDVAGVNDFAQRRGFGRGMYRSHDLGDSWIVGQVASASASKMILQTSRGPVVLIISPETKLPLEKDTYASGSFVRAVGELKGEVFEAKGIMPGVGKGGFQKIRFLPSETNRP